MSSSSIYSFPGLPFVLSYVKTALISILRTGPIPKHVAIVMDGNRRYARKHKQETREGHNAGFESLAQTLELCYNAGVEVVTVFAFSIENFNRTKYEVDSLMEVAKSRLTQISDNGELAEQYGIRISIVGDRSKLPADVLAVAQKVEKITRHNSKARLNVCFPYTSRDEMATAIRNVVSDAKKGKVNSGDITEDTIDEAMMFADCPPLDILIRSSGVERFSDFMMWQAHQKTTVEFVSSLWPEFGFRQMYSILLRWSLKRACEQEDQEETQEASIKDE